MEFQCTRLLLPTSHRPDMTEILLKMRFYRFTVQILSIKADRSSKELRSRLQGGGGGMGVWSGDGAAYLSMPGRPTNLDDS